MRIDRRSVLVFAACVLVLCVWAGGSQAPAAEPARVTLTLLSTTDLHGNIEPIDYYSGQASNRGLEKIDTLVNQERAADPDALLLDCGDTIQGTLLAYLFAIKDTTKPNPTIAVMNAMRYDAAALGNHEFNFGLDVLWKVKREAKFPMMAANIQQTYAKGSPEYFSPYVLKTVHGVRVGIVGFVTPGVPRWEIPDHYRGYTFEPIVAAAKRVIPEVRKQADLVVVLAHSGLGPDPEKNQQRSPEELDGENAVLALAEAVPEIDVIFFGHTHQEVPERMVNGVVLTQPRNWGQSLSRVRVELERDAQNKWKIASKHATTIPVTASIEPDAEMVKLAAPYAEETRELREKPVATSSKEMTGLYARYMDEPLVDLIHRVQLEASHADVSMATMLLAGAHIPAGEVRLKDVASLYIYPNTLYAVEMTGARLKEALEHAASFFSGWPLQPDEKMKLPGYNADSAEGVSYVMDLRRPVGDRIRDLTFKGKPLDPAQKLRVAINNYRYTGGGHYDVYKGLPIVYRSSEEVLELLLDHVMRTKTIPAAVDENWRIEPKEALDAILEEAKRAQQPRTTGPGSR